MATSPSSSATAWLKATLASWGLSSLYTDALKLVQGGVTSDSELSLSLQQTDAYKKRFAGNALRQKAGLPELSPAQYIALEEQYQNTLRSYGLPSGFYDSHDDFTKMIGNDISPAELADRAQIAHDQYTNAPDEIKKLWSSYGYSKGDAIAGILDPTVGTQIIKDRAAQVGIGGAAAQQGLSVSQPRAQQLQQAGVTLQGARDAYQKIAQVLGTDQNIAHRFGTTFDQSQEEDDLLLGDAEADTKRRTLYDSEQALFGGSAGNAASVGVSNAR